MSRVGTRRAPGRPTSTMMCHRAPTILAIVIACSTLCPPVGLAQESPAHEEGPGAATLARTIELATMRSLQVLARARRLDDARAVRCLDPRVSELTSTFRQATERVARARRAERTGDGETVVRETAVLRRLVEHARTLERSALECMGHEREVEADWTEVDVRAPSAGDRRRPGRRYASRPR